MKAQLLLFCTVSILITSCSQYQQQKKHYYVGNHKFHQFQYGIHEDTGFPIGGSNQRAGSSGYKTHYKADGEQRQL